MLPKSPTNRSGRSTPIRGQSGKQGGIKKDDGDVKLSEEEEEKKRAEVEEKIRIENQRREKMEISRLVALEESRRESQLKWTENRLRAIKEHAESLASIKRENSMWNRYMRCDGSPDPTVLTQVNTFIDLTKETGEQNMNSILDEAKDVYALIYELKFLLSDPLSKEVTSEQKNQYKETILALQDLLFQRYNDGTLQILKEAIYQADSESGNLQKVICGEHEIIMLWGNLNKNPRFKTFTFCTGEFAFELPKPLAMAEIAIRNLKTKYDFFSHQCSTFYSKSKKAKEIEERFPTTLSKKEEEAMEHPNQNNELTEIHDGINYEDDETRSSANKVSVTTKDGEEKDVDKTTEGENICSQSCGSEDDENLDDVLEEDVIDLQQYHQLGGIFHIDLIRLPPQPNTTNRWTMHQVVDAPLTILQYPSEMSVPMLSPSRCHSAKEGDGDTGSITKLKLSEEFQPAVGITIKLPSDVMFFEEPQVAKWDQLDHHWKTAGIRDVEYDEKSKMLSFKSHSFGSFCLMQDLHLNMPFQQWELRPLGQNHCLFTITAAVAEVFIEIKGNYCRLQAPEDDESKVSELQHLNKRWMSSSDLVAALKESGINIFPSEESEKFVSIQNKDVKLESIYEQMALLSSTFAFTWSKWNSLVPKDEIVLQIASCLHQGDASFDPISKRTAYNLGEEDWLLFLVKDVHCYRLKISEYDDSFMPNIASGAEYHSDLVHAVMKTSFRDTQNFSSQDQICNTDRSVDDLHAFTVMTLLKSTKFISYS